MEKKIRRYRSALVTNGLGIITLGMWGVIKVIMILLSSTKDIGLDMIDDRVKYIVYIIVTALVIILVAGTITGLNLYMGLSAYREGIKGKKGSFYLVIMSIDLLVTIADMLIYLFFLNDTNAQGLLTIIAGFFIDLTKALLLLDTIYAAVMSRKLKKRLEQ